MHAAFGCLCYCKDTNFKANHNSSRTIRRTPCVVYATAKILILKQITTQRIALHLSRCCLCYCKDTNFKANHNTVSLEIQVRMVVYATAKILILKQITTVDLASSESNRCLCYCKDTNFKANHNRCEAMSGY